MQYGVSSIGICLERLGRSSLIIGQRISLKISLRTNQKTKLQTGESSSLGVV